MNYKIANFFMDIAIILIGLYLACLKSYFTEKGKDVATKQDIGDITKIVEGVKSEFTREIEILKISFAEIQLKKIELFQDLYLIYHDVLFKRVEINEEINKRMNIISSKLFYFASDDTIRKFLAFRSISIEGASTKKLFYTFSDLFISIRKDIGWKDTQITNDDFLNLLVIDWDKHKKELVN